MTAGHHESLCVAGRTLATLAAASLLLAVPGILVVVSECTVSLPSISFVTNEALAVNADYFSLLWVGGGGSVWRPQNFCKEAEPPYRRPTPGRLCVRGCRQILLHSDPASSILTATLLWKVCSTSLFIYTLPPISPHPMCRLSEHQSNQFSYLLNFFALLLWLLTSL